MTWWALVMRPAGHPPSDTPGAQASTQGTPHRQHAQGYTDKGRGTGSHPHPDTHGTAHGPPRHTRHAQPATTTGAHTKHHTHTRNQQPQHTLHNDVRTTHVR